MVVAFRREVRLGVGLFFQRKFVAVRERAVARCAMPTHDDEAVMNGAPALVVVLIPNP